MVYISSDGKVVTKKEWSLSKIPDMFWGLINFIVLFFQTLINPDLTKRGTGYMSDYANYRDGRPPPGFPRRRMGRFFGGAGPGPPPMAGGG